MTQPFRPPAGLLRGLAAAALVGLAASAAACGGSSSATPVDTVATRQAAAAEPARIPTLTTSDLRTSEPIESIQPLPGPASDESLVAFADCAELERYVRDNAMRGVPTPSSGGFEEDIAPLPPSSEPAPAEPAPAEPAPAEPAPAAPAPAEPAPAEAPASEPEPGRDGAAPAPSSTGTNVQEAGVDEPDLLKTDGTTIYALARQHLYTVGTVDGRLRVLDSIDLGGFRASDLLVAAGKVLVIGSQDGYTGLDGVSPSGSGITRLLGIDASDPAALRVVQTLSVEGGFVTARLTGATARIVVSSPLAIDLGGTSSSWLDDWDADAQGAEDGSTQAEYLPAAALEDVATGAVERRPLVRCDQVGRPPAYAGAGLLSVLTIDLGHGLEPVDLDAILTAGQVVYASSRSLYVATQVVSGDALQAGAYGTAIHRFDTSRSASTSYAASGGVRGAVLNQWSFSEDEAGRLRVATTGEGAWWETAGASTESYVSVLAEQDGRLDTIGQVGGLGQGERIYGVRFIGDIGYVVTFRQTDPLYTVDLSDPTAPRVAGELKIPGYSAYLHPVGDGLLLGIGQDATETGQVLGTQIALFDVSDVANPTQLAKRTLDGAQSEAEANHHAFTFDPEESLGILPVSAPGASGDFSQTFGGALAFTVDREAGIDPRGRIEHPMGDQIRRAIVLGGTIYTLSEAGVEATDAATLRPSDWAPFA